ncbi:MAG: hydrogenase maturation nickel metallochaperone HypA [Proteobacteria bacterium]|nr:hydrogenase maturation nickel metallochaperone HypA [Pseudomonadota bacterium]
MHEMGIAIRIMEIVKQSMPTDEDVVVKSINLKVGKLTAVVPSSLRMCMEVVTMDTPVAGAKLNFTEVPVRLKCLECKEISEIEEAPFICSSCGSPKTEAISGSELFIESIEVSEPDGTLSQ